MNRAIDIVVIGAGPGGLSAAGSLALHGREVVVISDGHLMGYGIEGAFKSKAAFEIANLYATNNNFLEAATYFRTLLPITNGNEDIRDGLCFFLNEIGNHYQINRKYKLAKDCFEEVLTHNNLMPTHFLNF